MSEKLNPFADAQRQLDEVAKILNLPPSVHELLRWPMYELQVSFPVRMDDGRVKVFHGSRVQYNNARGPFQGGLFLHPAHTIDTIRAHAAWMTWKTAVLDLPLGGAKGGINCNPREMSWGELERLSRGYIRAISKIIGEDTDVVAPDVTSNPQMMAWMIDEYSALQGCNMPGIATGRPIPLGGSKGRGDATARGSMYCIREAARVLGLNLEGLTAAIQGYGNAGQCAHLLGKELLGLKVVAVGESKGCILNPDGLEAKAVIEHKNNAGAVKGFPGAREITSEELLELDVTILIPAALQHQIGDWNAANIKARIVAELANGPTTPEADEILHKNGVYVIPDFLCNEGDLIVSYFEQVQNTCDYYWDEETVHERLDQKMTTAFQDVHEVAQRRKVQNRLAAYLVAVNRVTEAVRLRGWV